MRGARFLLPVLLCGVGCGKKVPNGVRAVLDQHRDEALKVAAHAASVCPSARLGAPFQPNPVAAPPPPPNPARGTALEKDARVVDVFVTCSWLDPRQEGDVWAGTSLPSLKGTSPVATKPVTTPAEMATNTCTDDPDACEVLVVPSRYGTAPRSADLRLVRRAADGGRVDVVVVVAER